MVPHCEVLCVTCHAASALGSVISANAQFHVPSMCKRPPLYPQENLPPEVDSRRSISQRVGPREIQMLHPFVEGLRSKVLSSQPRTSLGAQVQAVDPLSGGNQLLLTLRQGWRPAALLLLVPMLDATDQHNPPPH